MINYRHDQSHLIRTDSREAPSLRVWGVSVAVTLLLIIGLFFLFAGHEDSRDSRFQKNHLKRIRRFERTLRAEDQAPVVLLGTSLLAKCVSPNNLDNCAREMGQGNMRFLSLFRPRGNIHHYLPLMENIGSMSPKLLLIQSDLLFYYEYASPYSLDFLLNLPKYVTTIIRTRDRIHLREWQLKHAPWKYLTHKIRVMNNRMLRSTVDRRIVRDLIEHFQTRNIRVVIFDIPRSDRLEAVKNRLRRKYHGEFMRFLKEECQVPWLVFPRDLGHSLFSDYAHFTPAGGRKFIEWLIPEIHRLLRERVLP